MKTERPQNTTFAHLTPEQVDALLAKWQAGADRALAYRVRPKAAAEAAFLAGVAAATATLRGFA